MMRITRRRLLGGVAAASLPVALPAGAEGKSDLEVVQMLIDAHKAALVRWDGLPDDIWPEDCPLMDVISDELDRTAEAICFYRPATLEGVHLKAKMMLQTQFFVDPENEDYFSRAELISGFLPAEEDLTV
jgi:hypothetical protein